jgi:NAD(P)-dependent dehydrogenase (short-subunit alcohol dehydrogenase family)
MTGPGASLAGKTSLVTGPATGSDRRSRQPWPQPGHGWWSTTITGTYWDGNSEQFLASLEAMSAFGRLGQPDEIAVVVAFLASDQARWITAQNIRVNGGSA